jgi:hypothetical protein
METQTADQKDRNESGHDMHVIFVGDIQEKWREPVVTAKQIMEEAGITTADQFVLEALTQKGGTPVAEFNAADNVDLTVEHRKFFRVTPGGGGRS